MPTTKASIGYGLTFEIAPIATPTDFEYVAEIFNFTPPSFTVDTVDATHMQSPNRTREYIPGLKDSGSASFEMNYIPGSDADKLMRGALGKQFWCRVTFPNGVQTLFNGSPETYEISAPTDDRMTANVSFKVSGDPVLTPPAAPFNIVEPEISGTPKVGAPLTLDPGIWGGAMELAYQWKVDGTPVAGATASSYVPVAGDVGDTVTCEVTAKNDGFSTSLTTDPTAAVVA